MTPYELSILLHYYACADDPSHIYMSTQLWRETIESFLDLGLLDRAPDPDTQTYKSTRKLHVFVEDGLMEVQLPEVKWVVRHRNTP